MEALILTVFISVGLVAGAVVFFGWNVRQRSHEHAERLALLPLAEESQQTASTETMERKWNGD
ncbi:MAG: cytochrome oxidase [Myxococcales bacterium]|nr:cytochrome oxidase [Myxococcales bacterium]